MAGKLNKTPKTKFMLNIFKLSRAVYLSMDFAFMVVPTIA